MNDFISNVILLNVPFNNTYEHVLTFNNQTSQYNYFISKTVYNAGNNFNYIRKEGSIQIEKPIDTLYNCNYIMYQNTRFSNKWFYAFITDLSYVNEETTRISFEIDVYQTFIFDVSFKNSFVEREHVSNDSIGLHTVPEQLETGEYIWQTEQALMYVNYYICFALTEDIKDATPYPNNTYNRVYSGLTYVLVEDGTNAGRLIRSFDESARANAIYTMFLVPRDMFESKPLTWILYQDFSYAYVPTSNASFIMPSFETTKPVTLGDYTPRNNKLFCYPYRYLLVSNSNGQSAIYNFEDFEDNENNTYKFSCYGAISPGCQIRIRPEQYKKGTYEEGLTCGKFPVCSWINDPYVNWLSQESVNMGLGLLSDASSMISSAASQNSGAAISTGLNAVFNTVSQIYTHSLIPKQAHVNTNSSELVFALGNTGFRFYSMCIKPEYAKIIDDYFDMYGYKVNEVKIPNLNNRPNWNYVKTIGCNITADIPQIYIDKIKDIFNNGVTLWHNPNTIYDYSQNNK